MISIINKVDLKPLNEELYARPKPPSYLIMNEDTCKMIEEEVIFDMPDSFRQKVLGQGYMKYRNIPIAVCNAVALGYIDIKD